MDDMDRRVATLESAIETLTLAHRRWRRAAMALGLTGIAALSMAASRGTEIHDKLAAKEIYLVSDAGTPLISLVQTAGQPMIVLKNEGSDENTLALGVLADGPTVQGKSRHGTKMELTAQMVALIKAGSSAESRPTSAGLSYINGSIATVFVHGDDGELAWQKTSLDKLLNQP